MMNMGDAWGGPQMNMGDSLCGPQMNMGDSLRGPQMNMGEVWGGPQMGLSWIDAQDGNVPPRAIEAGPGTYIGRTEHNGSVALGKILPSCGKGYFPWGGIEHEVYTYQVLCDNSSPMFGPSYSWVASCDGFVPENSIVGGTTNEGNPLYIARANIDGEYVVGKVPKGGSHAYFPCGGIEHRERQYEVLVSNQTCPCPYIL